MTIQELIDSLDEKRREATPGEWKAHIEGYSWTVRADGKAVFDDGSAGYEYEAVCNKKDREYIIFLHNSYEALRTAALESERYRKAGEELAERIRNTSCPCCVKCYSKSFVDWKDSALKYWGICFKATERKES